MSFAPSPLGTKEYWDGAYSKELTNFKESGDTGEVWFGLQSERRIVQWMTKNTQRHNTVLDIGCGNGSLLMELIDGGFSKLIGIDYSHDAIQLATTIAERDGKCIDFQVVDLLDSEVETCPLNGKLFDVCLDKGTYDAICLSHNEENRSNYIQFVDRMLHKNGHFVLASCNWTEEELRAQFNRYFTCVESIPAPTFQFGGKTGQTVTTLVFTKTVQQ